MKLDRPARTGDAVGSFARAHDVRIHEPFHSVDGAGLTHADLGAIVDEIGVLAARNIIFQELKEGAGLIDRELLRLGVIDRVGYVERASIEAGYLGRIDQ